MDATPAPAAVKPPAGVPTAPPPTKIATPPLTGIGKVSLPSIFFFLRLHNDSSTVMIMYLKAASIYLQDPRLLPSALAVNPQVLAARRQQERGKLLLKGTMS